VFFRLLVLERFIDGDLKQLPGSVLVDCRHTFVTDPLSGHVHFSLGCQVGIKELLVKVSANKKGTLSEQPLAAFSQEFRCGDGLRPTRHLQGLLRNIEIRNQILKRGLACASNEASFKLESKSGDC
jgi:hypothetical protein